MPSQEGKQEFEGLLDHSRIPLLTARLLHPSHETCPSQRIFTCRDLIISPVIHEPFIPVAKVI